MNFMRSEKAGLKEAVKQYVQKQKNSVYDSISSSIEEALVELADEGFLELDPDYRLTGKSLEIRVKKVLEEVGFTIRSSREGFEDFIIIPPENTNTRDPIVLEVKSSRQPQIKREDLRQLDDWVFDLSNEHKARKHGLGGGGDLLSYASGGVFTSINRRPSPHKGVMIFNGPVSTQFDQRRTSCLAANDIEFVEKRNFCVVPFESLLTFVSMIRDYTSTEVELWEKLHECIGVLQ